MFEIMVVRHPFAAGRGLEKKLLRLVLQSVQYSSWELRFVLDLLKQAVVLPPCRRARSGAGCHVLTPPSRGWRPGPTDVVASAFPVRRPCIGTMWTDEPKSESARPRAGFVPNFRSGLGISYYTVEAFRGGFGVVFGQSCQGYLTRNGPHILCVRKHICTVRVDAIMQVANLVSSGSYRTVFSKEKLLRCECKIESPRMPESVGPSHFPKRMGRKQMELR
jgi:hypothetical protein